MKHFFVILLFSQCSLANEPLYLYVNTTGGLNIRAEANASSKKVGKLACGDI